MKQESFRSILKKELQARCERNPRYSLRSFARDLQVSAPRLSEVLKGRYGLSRGAAEKIAARVGMGPSESAVFCDLVDQEHARSRKNQQDARKRLAGMRHKKVDQLTLDSFAVIADWYHYALLELTLVKGFKSERNWIASKLGISIHVVEPAIERLRRLGLLEGSSMELRASSGFSASPTDVPSEALKKFHQQLLQKAIDAIRLQSVDERDVTSVTLAFDRSEMKKAKTRIRNFRREFDAEFSKSVNKDSVYCLAIQFFNLQERD